MNVHYTKKWSIFTFIIACIIIWFYVKGYIHNVNSWVYNINGDSLKNYYNVILSAKHSQGLWLNNVNYPFGEQLFFLDSQPFLAKFLSFFHLENYTIGFINFLPILSIAATSIPLFLIQRTLKIPLMLNIITAIIIALLSPQVGRVSVHFALAYTIYIPLLIYLLIHKVHKEIYRYTLITCVVILFSFLHPYYLLIAIVLLVSFLPYHIFFQMNKKTLFFNILAIIIPLMVVKISLILSDPILDRPESPFGIWKYRSTFESVFFPKFKPFIELISGPLQLKAGTFEGNAYVGILGFPILIFSLIKLIIFKIKKQTIRKYFRNEKYFYLFFSSVLIWIFALYFPLKFIIDPLLEIAPILKQFRSLGRFGWIFYYTFSIFITIVLSNLFSLLKNKTNLSLAYFTTTILCLLWFLDANGNMNTIKYYMSKSHTIEADKSSYLSNNEIDELVSSSFDAILTLPIFHVGSEISNFEGSNLSIFESYKVGNKLNIPFVSTYSSRVSKKQFLLIKDLKETGNLSQIFKNNETVLIIADKELLSDAEFSILNRSKILFQKDRIVYAIFSTSQKD